MICLRCEKPIYQDDEGTWRREVTGSDFCPRNLAGDGHEPQPQPQPHAPCWRSECRVACYYPAECSVKRATPPLTVAQPAAGPTPHAHAREPQTGTQGFQWPCGKRKAHGPHPVTPRDADAWGEPPEQCPGVKVHPDTMIGRQ